MLRVVTLSSLFPDASRPGFGGFVARQTAGLAARDDVDLRVVAPIGTLPPPFDRLGHHAARRSVARWEDWEGLFVHRPRFLSMPGTNGRFHAAAMARTVRPVLDRMRDKGFAFDVIDAQFFFPDGPAAVALGRRYGVPVSIKARGSDVHVWGRAPATAAQVRAAGQAADGLLAVSAAMRDDMIALGMPGARIRVHHTGVDLDRFAPVADRAAARRALGLAGPLVLGAGTLNGAKGHHLTLQAVARLPGVRCVIAGEGPDAAALAALIEGLGIGDRATLAGRVAHDALAALMAAADVFCLPSASEGLANVWVEALASGTPVVTCDVGGAREVFDRPEAGRLVARDADAVAAGIADLLADPPGSSAVRKGAERFTWAANADALHAHLAELVQASRA